MPFKSKSQKRYMFSQHPRIAKRWADETKNIKKLPEKIAAYRSARQRRYMHAKKRSGEIYLDPDTKKWVKIHNPSAAATGSLIPSNAVQVEKLAQKVNAPTFAYKTVYGRDPDNFLPGRTNDPKKNYKGLLVDKGLSNKWLNSLNSLPVEIRSTDEGKSPERPAFVILRMPEGKDGLYKKMVKNLKRNSDLKVMGDIGMMGRPRICVAGKIWKGRPNWRSWWDSLTNKILMAYQNTVKDEMKKVGFCDEMDKVSKRWLNTLKTKRDWPSPAVRWRWLKKEIKKFIPKNLSELKRAYTEV